MVLLECLGDRVGSTPIQIFGTDISAVSIEKARAGVYSESSLGEVSPERLRRFFVKVEGGFQIAKSLREMCVFARQDLAQDPPFSRLDLISCRNVLIYMGPVLQKKVMAIFHYALKPTGFLMQGKSESISGFADLFTVIDREHKICSKKPAEPGRVFDLSTAASYERAMGAAAGNRKRSRGSTYRGKRTGSSSANTHRPASSSMRTCTFSTSAGSRVPTFLLRRARRAWACSAWCARN
jgi:hypothetical protein